MKPVAAKNQEELVGIVREKYGEIAKSSSSCCGSGSADILSIEVGYDAETLESVPDEANLGLGCGAPIGYLELQSGETALDLGSGPGNHRHHATGRQGDPAAGERKPLAIHHDLHRIADILEII